MQYGLGDGHPGPFINRLAMSCIFSPYILVPAHH